MYLKRGCIVLSIVIILTFLVAAEEETSGPLEWREGKYLFLGYSSDPTNADHCDRTDASIRYKIKQGDSLRSILRGDLDECDPDPLVPFGNVPKYADGLGSVTGCWFITAEEDDGEDGDWDGAWSVVTEGHVVDSTYSPLSIENAGSEEDWFDQCDDDSINGLYCYIRGSAGGKGYHGPRRWESQPFESWYSFASSVPILCSADGFWYECTDFTTGGGSTIGMQAYANNHLYECVLGSDNSPTWEDRGVDLDHDSYPLSIDCSDDPSSDPAFCSDIESTDDCSQLKYSTCSICINPSAPEVCGDGINNDCRGDDNADGTVSYMAVDNPLGETPDDCNHFQAGCEQAVIEISPDSSDEEPTPVQHRNVDNGYYSWINTPEGGYCCGYASGEEDKSGDVGMLGPEEVEGIWKDDRYVCLPSPGSQTAEFLHDVVGSGDENIPGWEEAGCGEKDWCWIHAQQATSTGEGGPLNYPIISIEDLGDETTKQYYDIVSNNEQWVECKAEGTNGVAVTDDVDNALIGNRFYCYNEGNRWSWAECLDEFDFESSVNGIKKSGRKCL